MWGLALPAACRELRVPCFHRVRKTEIFLQDHFSRELRSHFYFALRRPAPRGCTAAALLPDWVLFIYTIMSHSASQMSSVDGDVVAEVPDLRRQRVLEAGKPIEDDEIAREKMRDAEVGAYHKILTGRQLGRQFFARTGFDPDNVTKTRLIGRRRTGVRGYGLTAMSYFSSKGDLPMMRWLYVNGADVNGPDMPRKRLCLHKSFYSPVLSAALECRDEAVKWLFFHGAAKDVTRATTPCSPFQYLACDGTQQSLVKWLILHGAFCRDGNVSGDIDVKTIKFNMGRLVNTSDGREGFADIRRALLEWAVELHESRISFLTFLRGTLARVEGKAASPLACLGGQSDIIGLVAEYSGLILGREARIIRQLVEVLPRIYRELEDIEDRWELEGEPVYLVSWDPSRPTLVGSIN